MRTDRIVFLAALILPGSTLWTTHAAGAASKPNVVIILTDEC